jgi:hypothetical protein
MKKVNEKNKLENHKKIIKKLSKNKTIIAYKKYLDLDNQTKYKLKNKWKKYYEKVKKCEEYLDLVKQKEAFRTGNMKLVKEIAQKQRDKLNGLLPYKKIKKPSSIDPVFLIKNQDVMQYNISLKVIERLESRDVKNVYQNLF